MGGAMKEARFYELVDPDKQIVQCGLCSHRCKIKNEKRGLCGVRENNAGKLYSLVYDRLVSENIDPIEKKPLFHVLPGSLSYSISTVGCNFRCKHCQNFGISQYPHMQPGPIPGARRTPEEIVKAAKREGCRSISYTYVEPTIFFELAYDTAKLAHKEGIKNVFVSNGYTTPEATRKIAPYLDANNIDLKAFTEKFYHEVCGAKLAPVLETIQLMKELNVWLEITTLVIPGWNDSEQELRDIARFIAAIDPGIPWHVSRFFPTFKMTDHPPTQTATLLRAREIGLEEGLKYVYTGNIPGQGGEDTFCPKCNVTVIRRSGFSILGNKLDNDRCKECGAAIDGIFQ
jgi:pyruvate formate lyase activating enzyme